MKRKHLDAFPAESVRHIPVRDVETGLLTPESPATTQEGSHDTKQDRLCLQCKAIDFKSIFALSNDKIHQHGLPVTQFRRDTDPACSFCSMVVSPLLGTPRESPQHSQGITQGYHLRVFDSLTPSRRRRFAQHVASNPSIVLAVASGWPHLRFQVDQINEAICRGLIAPVSEPSSMINAERGPFEYRGRAVRPRSIDFALLRSWIDDCRNGEKASHRKCNHVSGRTFFATRVIDCFTRKMVVLTEDMEYIALSYVWGPQSAADKTVSSNKILLHRLPRPAPRTIEDAITTVQGLDKRYLWVDRYCIWDSEDRHLQIQNMDQIYKNAVCTIVAAYGGDAESGLCGISSPRFSQPQSQTDAGLLVTTFVHLSHHLAKSVWASRGWTYQEAILSRRCLFFTSDQVYFVCKTLLRCEAALQSPIPGPDESQQTLGPAIMKVETQLSFLFNKGSTQGLYQHIEEYTSRSLTFDIDALNAFNGIISAGRTYTYYGLPILRRNTVDSDFAEALLWRSTGRHPQGEASRRREGHPTWSWTSLVDQVKYSIKVSGFWTGPIFFVEDQERQLVRFEEMYHNAERAERMAIPERSKYLHIESYVIKVRLESGKDDKIVAHPVSRTFLGLDMADDDDDDDDEEGYVYSLRKSVHVSLDLPNDEVFCRRFDKEEWTAVLLSQWFVQGVSYVSSIWMLLDWNGSTAQRVGLVQFVNTSVDSKKYPKTLPYFPERRTIRIE